MMRRKVQYRMVKPRMQGKHGCNVRIIRLNDNVKTSPEMARQMKQEPSKQRKDECNAKACHRVDNKININSEMKLFPLAMSKKLELTKTFNEDSRQKRDNCLCKTIVQNEVPDKETQKGSERVPNPKNIEFEKTKVQEYNIEKSIDDLSTDNEEQPKFVVPKWATKEFRKHPLMCQFWLEREYIEQWFRNENLKYPQVKKLFGENVKMKPRSSSAYWNTLVRFDERFPISSTEYASW